MRKLFKKELLKHMKENDNIYLLLGGVGYGYYEPDGEKIINCEASEQAMLDIAVGLSSEGKIPFVYFITPHIYRAFEGIRLYMNHWQHPVKLVGVGRDRDYGNLGFTHWAEDAKDVFDIFENVKQYWPNTREEVPDMVEEVIYSGKPSFISVHDL